LRDEMEDIDAVGVRVVVDGMLEVAGDAGCDAATQNVRDDTGDGVEDGVAVWLGLRVVLVSAPTTATRADTNIRSILSYYSVFIFTVICIDSNSRVYRPMQ
jgi:hypothetical protein